jgi:hypothetical protein
MRDQQQQGTSSNSSIAFPPEALRAATAFYQFNEAYHAFNGNGSGSNNKNNDTNGNAKSKAVPYVPSDSQDQGKA